MASGTILASAGASGAAVIRAGPVAFAGTGKITLAAIIGPAAGPHTVLAGRTIGVTAAIPPAGPAGTADTNQAALTRGAVDMALAGQVGGGIVHATALQAALPGAAIIEVSAGPGAVAMAAGTIVADLPGRAIAIGAAGPAAGREAQAQAILAYLARFALAIDGAASLAGRGVAAQPGEAYLQGWAIGLYGTKPPAGLIAAADALPAIGPGRTIPVADAALPSQAEGTIDGAFAHIARGATDVSEAEFLSRTAFTAQQQGQKAGQPDKSILSITNHYLGLYTAPSNMVN